MQEYHLNLALGWHLRSEADLGKERQLFIALQSGISMCLLTAAITIYFQHPYVTDAVWLAFFINGRSFLWWQYSNSRNSDSLEIKQKTTNHLSVPGSLGQGQE